MPRVLSRAERSEARLNTRGADLGFGVGASFAGYFRGRVRRVTGSALSLLAGREPKAFAVHLKNVDVMGEAIEQRAGEPFVSIRHAPQGKANERLWSVQAAMVAGVG